MRSTHNPEPQPVIAKGDVETTAEGFVSMCSTIDEEGIKRTLRNIDGWKRAAIQLAMTNLCQAFGELSPHESLMARETIATTLQRILSAFVIEWGLTVNQPVDIPGDGNRREQVRQERLG